MSIYNSQDPSILYKLNKHKRVNGMRGTDNHKAKEALTITKQKGTDNHKAKRKLG